MPDPQRDRTLLTRAIALSREALSDPAGGPFGAVVARGERVIGEGRNRVLETGDPSAHAEVVAIRAACAAERTPHLTGCTLYASCEPCPMCLFTALWARLDRIVYAATRDDAAAIGFDDAEQHRMVDLSAAPVPLDQMLRDQAWAVMDAWARSEMRRLY